MCYYTEYDAQTERDELAIRHEMEVEALEEEIQEKLQQAEMQRLDDEALEQEMEEEEMRQEENRMWNTHYFYGGVAPYERNYYDDEDD